MSVIAKTVWFVESNLARSIELDEIAETAGVSRFHLTRAFGHSLGRSVMRYARGRRLTEAARQLAAGAPDILSVALDAGYASHEAFTRAFRDEFGVTPEQLRASPDLSRLKLQEPIRMNAQPKMKLAEPAMIDAEALLFVGIGHRYRYEAMGGIPGQWQRFNQHLGSIPNEIGGAAYGVCANADGESMDYICAVAVTDFSLVDKEMTRLRAPAQRYAVFKHAGHISDIQAVFHAIYEDWLPASGIETADAPSFERYLAGFDPVTGKGGFEIWIPIKS